MTLVRYLHLLAMAFLVGGQILLAAAVVPWLRADSNRERLRAIARRFESLPDTTIEKGRPP